MTFRVAKTYGHDLGLSCCFRQWRAQSHCHCLHGYALAFELVFEADRLDENGWVIDFGALKPIKQQLADLFDHAMQVAADDPELELFRLLDKHKVCRVVVVRNVGAEAFAAQVFDFTAQWLASSGYRDRVRLVSVTASEHGANAATSFGALHDVAA